MRDWIYGRVALPLDQADEGEFMRHAPEPEQRVYRAGLHEVLLDLAELRTFVLDALDRRHPTSNARQHPMEAAEALRRSAARVAASVERLADRLKVEIRQHEGSE